LPSEKPGVFSAPHKPKEEGMISDFLNKAAPEFILPSKHRQIPGIRAFRNCIPIANCRKNEVRKTL
jgi:hypothetical protein